LSFFWCFFSGVLIGVNDAFAYFSGMTLGRTPLIKLSPNKTVEGFLGGALFTQVFVIWFTNTYFQVEEYICMDYGLNL
jgi:phosphatidate cytidylyltransferase